MDYFDENSNNNLLINRELCREIIEIRFFEYHYNKRKFLIDEDVFGCDDVPEKIKNTEINKYIGIMHGDRVYLKSQIEKFLIYFKKLSNNTMNLNNCHKILNELQIARMYKYYNDSEYNKYKVIFCKICHTKYNEIIKDKSTYDFLSILMTVSLKYGAFITDLYKIDELDSLLKNTEDINIFRTRSKFPWTYDLLTTNIDEREIETKHTLYNKLKDYIFNKNPIYISKNFLKKARKKYFDFEYHTNSAKSRIIGLWLWDRIENPLLNLGYTYSKAQKELIEKYQYLIYNKDISSIKSSLNRI